MTRPPPCSTRTDTRFPYPTRFLSGLGRATATQNRASDRVGVVNRLYGAVHWLKQRARALKHFNRTLYKVRLKCLSARARCLSQCTAPYRRLTTPTRSLARFWVAVARPSPDRKRVG